MQQEQEKNRATRVYLELLKQVNQKVPAIISPKKERGAVIVIKRHMRLEPKILLNVHRRQAGVPFEAFYHHLVLTGHEFHGLTHDHSLDNILFNFFVARL